MARKNGPVSADELHALASNIEDWGLSASACADKMDKALSTDVGDELELLSKLAGAAENILNLHRKIMGSARMLKQSKELEAKLKNLKR